jgi:hypothetical protein
VRATDAAASVQYLQYGLGLVLVPRFPLSIIAELNGLIGFNNADAYRSLFVVAGLRVRAWKFRVALAAQIPVWDGAQENLGSWAGYDVGGLSRYTVLSRVSAAF